MLERLANDELIHIRRIKEIYKFLNEEDIEPILELSKGIRKTYP